MNGTERSGVGVKTESMTEEKREKAREIHFSLATHVLLQNRILKKNDFFADCTPVGK